MKVNFKIFVSGNDNAVIDDHMEIPNDELGDFESLNEEERALELYTHVYFHAHLDEIEGRVRTEINY